MKKRMVAVLLMLVMLIQGSIINVCGEEVGGIVANSEFTVSEKAGLGVKNYLVQRGIPIDKGILFEGDKLWAVSDNEFYPLQTSVLEKYDDGSIKFLGIALEVSLTANENKRFELCKDSSRTYSSKLRVTESGGEYTVSNANMTARFSNAGLLSLVYNGNEILKSAETSVCTQSNVQHTSVGTSVEIYNKGDVFVTLKIKQSYPESNFSCEKLYTISENSENIFCEVGYVADKRMTSSYNCEINGFFEQYTLLPEFSETKSGAKDEYISLKNNQITVTFASRDVLRFKNAMGSNGFYKSGNTVLAAPLVYDGSYQWMDGMTGTISYEIDFSDINAEGKILCQEKPPYVMVLPERYVSAGLIESTGLSAVANAQVEELKWAHKKNYGKVEAGAIPHFIDKATNQAYNAHMLPGETDYNVWFAAMASDDAELFNLLSESTRRFIDLSIYEGFDESARGVPRYRILYNDDNDNRSRGGHLYYGEFSNLYLSYLMTGKSVYKDKMYEMANSMYNRTMHNDANLFNGYHLARAGSLHGNLNLHRDSYEARNAFVIRALWNCYKTFEDDRFKYLCQQLSGWLNVTQEADGSWPQLIDPEGNGVKNVNGTTGTESWVMYKNYIMLYYMRGVAEYYQMSGDETALSTIKKFADYLIAEMSDRGWMWDPCGDKNKCETGEDLSRGKSPIQEIMSTQIFALMFDETKEEKYFKAMCEALESYISCCGENGFAAGRYNDISYLSGTINDVITAQNTTLLRMDSVYRRLFAENSQLLDRLGFTELKDVFISSKLKSDKVKNSNIFNEVTAKYFEGSDGNYLFYANNSGFESGLWSKTVQLTVKDASRLWSGVLNRKSGNNMTISKKMNYFKSDTSKELPITVVNGLNALFEVARYDKDAVILRAFGSGDAELKVTDGIFSVDDNQKYLTTIFNNKNGTYIVLTQSKAGNIQPVAGEINISLQISGTDYFSRMVRE